MIAFETTLLTTRPAPGFRQALDAARRELSEQAKIAFDRAIDIVLFDEASQITTWDAIGAIARGRQDDHELRRHEHRWR